MFLLHIYLFIYLSYIEYTNNLNSTKKTTTKTMNSSEKEKQYIYNTHTPRDMHILNLIRFHTEEFQQSVKISCCKTAIMYNPLQ